jgi:Fibronectin type III domain
LPHRKSAIRHLKSVFCLLIFLFVFSLVPVASDAIAASVTLGWDSNSEPDLEGYVVYRSVGSPGPPYDDSDMVPEDELANPLHPKATLTGLKEGNEYYVALTAYNTDGVESGFSNDVCVEVVNGVVEPCSAGAAPAPAASTASSSGGSGGGSGGGCFISASSDESSLFSTFFAGPPAHSRVMAITFLLLVLISAARPARRKAQRP